MKKILLFGNYGGQNWGDEAICAGMLQALRKSQGEITVVSANPQFTKHEHDNVASVPRPPFGLRSLLRIGDLWRFVRALKSADLVIYGGGGLLQDREPMAIPAWWYYMQWAKWFRKKYILVANSVGPLSNSRARMLVRSALRDCRFISLRDTSSRLLLLAAGIAPERIISATDAVFFLRRLPTVKRRSGTLVMLRGDGKTDLKRINKLLNDSAIPKPISLVAMDHLDKDFIQKLPFRQFEPTTLSELRRKIAKSRLVISARLHGCLLALNEETPFVALSAAPKIAAFLQDRQLEDFLVSETVSAKHFSTTIRSVLRKPRQLLHRKRMEERRNSAHILPFFLQ